MNKLLLIILFSTSILFSQKQPNPLVENKQNNETKIWQLQNEVDRIKNELSDVKDDIQDHESLSNKATDCIANQLSATSINISIFGILFGIAAIGLGIYVTYIERKIVQIKEENKSLLADTKLAKEEVIKINDQIQKDIYGLFLKIKREETVHILNRLTKVPEDITNLLQELLSRDLEKEDFFILKEAYLKLKSKNDDIKDDDDDEYFFLPQNTRLSYLNSYKLLFFQHFLDLTVKDLDLNQDLIGNYTEFAESAFENDIIKSTQDFMSAIVEVGYKTKEKEINAYIKAISKSSFQIFDPVYQIIIKTLKTREKQFDFFSILNDEDKELRIGKFKIGQILTDEYSQTVLSESEIKVLEKTKAIRQELDKESTEEKERVEKKKAAKEERKRKLEESKKPK